MTSGGINSCRVVAEAAADRLGIVRTEIHHGLLQRMATAEQGLRTPVAAGSAGTGRSEISDPTAEAALRGVDRVTALARLHQVELARCLDRAAAAIDRALAIARLYPEATPGSGDREAVAALNARSEPCCANCAKTTRADGQPRVEPVASALRFPTTVAHRLDRAMWLCDWCYDRVATVGRLPSPDELAAHHAGRRVPWPADVPAPAKVRRRR